MKHAFLLVSLLAVCTVGCAFDWYPQRVEGAYQRQMRMVRPMPAAHEEVLAPAEPGEEGVAAGPVGPIGPITPLPEGGPGGDPPVAPPGMRLVAKHAKQPPAPILSERMAVGFSLGNVYGNQGEAVNGLRDTDFENGMLTGVSFLYMPAMKKTVFSPHFHTRFGVEARLENFALMLDDDGLDLGKVHTNSMVFLFKLFQAPEEGEIFGFHFDIGMGWGSTWFEKDDMLRQDDISNGRHTSISTDTATIFTLGAGVDLLIAPDVAISLDLRYQDADIPVKWSTNGVYRTDVERLNTQGTHFAITLRYFF